MPPTDPPNELTDFVDDFNWLLGVAAMDWAANTGARSPEQAVKTFILATEAAGVAGDLVETGCDLASQVDEATLSARARERGLYFTSARCSVRVDGETLEVIAWTVREPEGDDS